MVRSKRNGKYSFFLRLLGIQKEVLGVKSGTGFPNQQSSCSLNNTILPNHDWRVAGRRGWFALAGQNTCLQVDEFSQSWLLITFRKIAASGADETNVRYIRLFRSIDQFQ